VDWLHNLLNAKLIVFVDGSFANKRDLSSQPSFVLMLVNKLTNVKNTLLICGNVVHYSLTKCKRVTQSVLASKIYSIVNSFNIGIAIATTLRIITERLSIAPVPLVICTNSYSLYKCLVKLRSFPVVSRSSGKSREASGLCSGLLLAPLFHPAFVPLFPGMPHIGCRSREASGLRSRLLLAPLFHPTFVPSAPSRQTSYRLPVAIEIRK
jgi:hypothetical protein